MLMCVYYNDRGDGYDKPVLANVRGTIYLFPNGDNWGFIDSSNHLSGCFKIGYGVRVPEVGGRIVYEGPAFVFYDGNETHVANYRNLLALAATGRMPEAA